MNMLAPRVLSHLIALTSGLAMGAFANTGIAAPSSGHPTLRIELHQAADVASTVVVLGDVAAISGGDPQTASRIAAIDFGRVAACGQPTFVVRESLARWIQRRAGLMTQDIVWGGADRCRVRLAAAAVVEGRDGGTAATSSLSNDALTAGRSPVPAASTRPAVRRGNLATLHSNAGMIQVESRVEVLEDGVVGQDVHVRLPGAAEGVLARVTGAGQVEVTQ